MDAETISIGTELTAGQSLDTNAAWLAGELVGVGLKVRRHVTVPDDLEGIRHAVAQAVSRGGIVLVTGGLGPTPDDVTREALAAAADRPLVVDPDAAAQIEAFFEKLGRSIPESNRNQARKPEGSTVLANPRGTAPGIRVQIGGAVVFALPGVPEEMRVMFDRSVLPELKAAAGGSAITSRALHCFGAGEAGIAERIADLMRPGREPDVGITAHEAVISVRITVANEDAEEAGRAMSADAEEIRKRLGTLVFGEGDETLQSVVGRLLTDNGTTVATAESCTGGLLAKMLTDVPGSSAYFVGGVVSYADAAKRDLLGIPGSLISRYGAVSEEVATALAEACRERFGSGYALATTGIAGPGGATADKPVGLVYVALAEAGDCRAGQLRFPEHIGRAAIRDRTCKALLNILRLRLLA